MAYNKNELIQKIQSIETLSNEEKAALIELLRSHKKYGLVWEDKPEVVEDRLRAELPVAFLLCVRSARRLRQMVAGRGDLF